MSKSNPPQGVCLLLVSSSPYSPAHQPTAAQLHPGETPAAVPPHPPVRGQLMRPSSPPSKAHVPSTFASISDIPFAHILSCAFARFIPLLPLHLSTWCALGSPVLLSLDIIPLHVWYFCSHSPNYSYLTIVTSKFKSATLFPLWIPYPNSHRLQLFQISTHSFRFLSCLLSQHLPPCFTRLPDTCVLTTWVSAHLSAQ